MQSAIRTLTLVAVLVGGGTACQTTPSLTGSLVESTSVGDIAAVNPVDIAVLPAETAPGVLRAPTDLIRNSAAKALVRRRYSPLAMDAVDETIAMAAPEGGGVLEASYSPGALGEDAYLELMIERWDMPDWMALHSIDATIAARLIDPRNPGGPALWEARLNREFRFTTSGGTASTTDRDLREACDEILRVLLSTLPGRTLAPEMLDELSGS